MFVFCCCRASYHWAASFGASRDWNSDLGSAQDNVFTERITCASPLSLLVSKVTFKVSKGRNPKRRLHMTHDKTSRHTTDVVHASASKQNNTISNRFCSILAQDICSSPHFEHLPSGW